jgi:hypothetical protein
MKYQYHVRAGGATKPFTKIVYRTNNKQAAYRWAWRYLDEHKNDKSINAFPSIYKNGKFECTLLGRSF